MPNPPDAIDDILNDIRANRYLCAEILCYCAIAAKVPKTVLLVTTLMDCEIHNKYRIGVFANIPCHYLDEIIIGICEAARNIDSWLIRGSGFYFETLDGMLEWQPDAIIATIVNTDTESQLREINIPIINVSGSLDNCIFPTVRSDDYLVGQLAAQHLLEQNLKHFGYWTRYSLSQWQLRQQGFVETLRKNGISQSAIHMLQSLHKWSADENEEAIFRWLVNLPKPVGLLACQDAHGQLISRIAARAGINIPGQIALIGVDNDEKICKLCQPPLSSIELRGRQIGAKAVELLKDILGGKPHDNTIINLPPEGLVPRKSTDMIDSSDEQMAHAIRYIRKNATKGLGVNEVVSEIAMSRRKFESAFKQEFNITPGAEIRRIQLQQAKKLLRNEQMPISEVARQSGFCDAEYMAKVFRRELELSPSAYRKSCRQ